MMMMKVMVDNITILDFLIREILLAIGAWKVKSHHCAKFLG